MSTFKLRPLGFEIEASWTISLGTFVPPPVFTVNPSITGITSVGETLTGLDGTITGGTVSARAWLRDGVPISGATSSTYVLVEADEGADIAFRVTATGAGGTVNGTSAEVGPVTAEFVLPAFSTAIYQGDSRTAGAGGWVVSGTAPNESAIATTGLTAVGSAALFQSLAGNKWLLKQGYMAAVGATSTRTHEERDQTTSTATTGNPANADTGVAADAQFSINSDGLETALTQTGDHIFSSSVSVNDNSGTAATFYNNPSTAWETLRTMARIADAYGMAGKVWYVGNEMPRGDSYWTMEAKTVTGGTCTATNTSNFVDGETFGALGAIGLFATGLPRPLTKVASAPAQDEYTVSGAGVYTFGGTAPTNVWINYNASPPSGQLNTPDFIKIVKEFCESSDANFVSTVNAVDYGIPGLQHNRPWVRVFDSYGALVDPATGSAERMLPGTGDNLQGLHTYGYGAYLVGKAQATKVAADYPDAPDLSEAPTRNNWFAARQSTGTFVYSGTLPPTMRTGFTTTAAPTLITINGSAVGAVNTATGAITGADIASGSLDFATGAWTITFTSVTNASQLWFEQDLGNGVLAFSGGVFDSWTEGTIGRNAVNNGLMDSFTAVGTGLLVFNGVSTLTGIAAADVPYGWSLSNAATETAIGAGTAVAAASYGTDADGYPFWFFDLEGRHTAAMLPALTSGQINSFASRITAGDLVLYGSHVRYARHPTVGKLYGNNGASGQAAIFLTGSVPRTHLDTTKNVVGITGRFQDQGTGLYQIDELIMGEESGAFDQYRMGPLVDTTGATFNGPQCIINTGRSSANVPVAYRMGFGRTQVRRRNDVA